MIKKKSITKYYMKKIKQYQNIVIAEINSTKYFYKFKDFIVIFKDIIN